MADRGLGGAIVSLIAYLVVLQGLLGAVADGAMAAPAAVPGGVLCSGGFAPTDPDDTGRDADHATCCMALCRAACLSGACLPGDGSASAFGRVSDPAQTVAETNRAGAQHAGRLRPEARAPPARG